MSCLSICVRRAGLLLALLSSVWAAEHVTWTGADLRRQETSWLAGTDGTRILANVLTYQTPAGGWAKGYDAHGPRPENGGNASYGGWEGTPTIDNGATWSEIRLLARAYTATQIPAYAIAVTRGLAFLLARQYPNGGWPQRSPLDPGGHQYGTHITYNDNAMVEVMLLMRAVATGTDEFAWCAVDLRAQAQQAFDRGVECLLATQVVREGQRTVWCQQHDAVTLAPTGARAYELPSLTACESARIVLLLMSLTSSDARIRAAVDGACAWFAQARISGWRVGVKPGVTPPDRILIADPAAPPMWARYYDLETGQPFFCSRDGIKKASWADITPERRNHYAWYGNWGERVLATYTTWSRR
jgi:PelA/Pel-15E family pectate lyase